jgi:hypothetical protein
MPRSFTLYWSKSLCDDMYLDGLSGEILDYTAGSRNELGGLRHGDQIYVLTVIRGDLFLIGRMTVADVFSNPEQAEALLGYEAWEADLHVVADRLASTPMYFLRPVEHVIVERIRFVTADEAQSTVQHRRDGGVNPQSVRGLREIDTDTVLMLEGVLEQRWYELPHSPESGGDDMWEGSTPEIPDSDFGEILGRFQDPMHVTTMNERARTLALDYYGRLGFVLERDGSISDDGCALLLRRGEERWKIGVRGVPGPEIAFNITDTELRVAFEPEPYEMFVVTSVLDDEPGIHVFTGQNLDELFDYRSVSYIVRLRTDDTSSDE